MIEKIRESSINEDVKAIISFGSAHNNNLLKNNSDEFSDLDLFVFTKSPDKYLNVDNIAWLECFGKPISVLGIKNPVENNMITRIMFDNLFCVDVIPISYSKFKRIKAYLFLKKFRINKLLSNYNDIENELKTFSTYLKRGHSIIYDRMNMVAMIDKIKKQFPPQEENIITENIFSECYHEFWQTAYRFLGKIVRNDIYYGLVLLDSIFKKRLVQMIEWETKYYYNNKQDLFFYGKKINLWAHKSTLENLVKTTFSFEKQNNLKVLKNHIILFQKASKNVAQKKRYHLQRGLETKILQKIDQFLK